MKKITTVLLTISACLLASCKPVLVSASKGKNLGLLLEGNPLAVNPSKSGQFLAARQALFNRDNAAAGFYFDQALPKGSTNLMLQEQSFLSHYKSGNLSRAAEIAVELEQLGSKLSLATEPALSTAVLSRDWQAVIALSDKIGQTDNGYIFSAGLRSLAFVGLGEPETALREQQRMLNFIVDTQLDVPREILTLQKAYLAEITGNTAEAVSLYESVSLHNKDASYAVLAVATGLWRLGAYESAEAKLIQYQGDDLASKRLIYLLKTNQTELIRKLDLRQLIAKFIFEVNWFGRLSVGQGFILPRIHLALSIWPELELARLILAQTYFEQPDYSRASVHLGQISSTSPYFNQAAMLKMEIAHQVEQAEAAFTVAENALAKLAFTETEAIFAHDKALILQYAGTIARRNERYERAIKYYEKSMALGRKTNFIYRNLGISYERAGQFKQAEDALVKALKLNPDDAVTLNYIGYWWVDENRRIEEAFDLIKKAVKLQPASGYFADSLGWAYFRQNKFDKAVQWLEKAIQLTPTDPLIADHLGDAYWKVGRVLEAHYKWKQALDMGIEDKYATIIEKKIAYGME
jgi:tetratricopeptide (TPR) repeat protein